MSTCEDKGPKSTAKNYRCARASAPFVGPVPRASQERSGQTEGSVLRDLTGPLLGPVLGPVPGLILARVPKQWLKPGRKRCNVFIFKRFHKISHSRLTPFTSTTVLGSKRRR